MQVDPGFSWLGVLGRLCAETWGKTIRAFISSALLLLQFVLQE
jgi:hypothetical protein